MIKNSQRQSGSALIIVVVVVIVAIFATLAFVFWKNISGNKSSQTTQITTQPQKAEVAPCDSDPSIVEEGDVFCSLAVGIKLAVPSVFEGKFAKADNYEVFKGTVDYTDRVSDGSSDLVYSAVISGNDNLTLTIAKEPLRSGYVDVSHMLQGTYYDTETGLLSNTTTPLRNYNSATDSYTTSGEYAVAATVPSFIVNGIKIYHGSDGDAGVRVETYFAVINDNIVKIILRHNAYMGPEENDPSTINSDQVFSELDSAIKKIEVVH